jgi:hypothetical protein
VPPAATYNPPKTPWGDPDYQGVWDYQSVIPMQRPKQYAGKPVLTEAEWPEFLERNERNQDTCGVGTRADEECTPEQLANVGAYNEFWDNRNIVRDLRTSLIVDPPDGLIPAMTPEGAALQKKLGVNRPDNRATFEDFHGVERCLAEQTPNGPQMYNSGVLWQQTPGWIVMYRERLDTRVIALDGRPHVDSNVRQWNGHSVGRFEGSTLVVETTNFTDKQFRGGIGATVPAGVPFGSIKLIEHWVPVSPTRMHYYATVEDPETWVRPWTFMLPWERDPTYTVFEYACHEGNIALGNALRGARELERAEATQTALPADQTSASLVGLTEAELQAKLGKPASTRQTEWTYKTKGGIIVLNAYLEGGKVKFVRPDNLPLAEVVR